MTRVPSTAAEYPHVSQQMKQLEEDTTRVLKEVNLAKSTMGRVLSAWDSYADCASTQQAWLEQSSVRHSLGHRAEVPFPPPGSTIHHHQPALYTPHQTKREDKKEILLKLLPRIT